MIRIYKLTQKYTNYNDYYSADHGTAKLEYLGTSISPDVDTILTALHFPPVIELEMDVYQFRKLMTTEGYSFQENKKEDAQ